MAKRTASDDGRGAASASNAFGDVLGKLSRLESNIGVTAAQPRDLSPNLDAEGKYLLALSRVLTGNDTCAAIYKTEQGQYLVSNNTGDGAHVRAVMSILQEYAIPPHDGAGATRKLSEILVNNRTYVPSTRTTAADPRALSAVKGGGYSS